MNEISIFPNKEIKPTIDDVKEKIGSSSFELWKRIYDMVYVKYPNGKDEWNYPGKKYGWSFRIKDNKRAILYFLPREKYFKIAFVFGDKAIVEIMLSDISDDIKNKIVEAIKHAEGSGISVDIKDEIILSDIEKLVEVKLNN